MRYVTFKFFSRGDGSNFRFGYFLILHKLSLTISLITQIYILLNFQRTHNKKALRASGCADPSGDCGDGDDCHPKCQWKCDEPVCNQVCEPVCEPPKCSTRCQELGCSKCEIKCNKPECEVRCPVKHWEVGACPECDTVCKDPLCHTECSNPEPECESVCEEPVCDWKCHRPSNCPKPKCALVAEVSSLSGQPEEEEECCGVPLSL